jgi:hypothetical protein
MTLVDSPLYPQDECSNSHDGLPLLLCFCCLMMEFSHYQQLYVGNDFSTEAAPKTSNGKDIIKLHSEFTIVTDLQGPPLEHMQMEKLQDLKKLAQHYARDRGSCDDIQLSYLETLEDRDNDNLRLAQMLAG